jgi:hypothetical protein
MPVSGTTKKGKFLLTVGGWLFTDVSGKLQGSSSPSLFDVSRLELTGFPRTSIQAYQPTLRKNPEERSSELNCAVSLKSHECKQATVSDFQ